MNIVREIQRLMEAVRRLEPSAGRGMVIEKSPSGTRYSLREAAGGAGQSAWRGMFELADASEVVDGELVHQVEIVNGADSESEFCGIAHVNRQPFQVARAKFIVTEHSYFYLKFSAPVEGETPVPAEVAASRETELQASTDTTVWHLIGQAWIEDEMLKLEQDHVPGNAYIEWYGPCLGLLEESDD
jgi:hypothetical protein